MRGFSFLRSFWIIGLFVLVAIQGEVISQTKTPDGLSIGMYDEHRITFRVAKWEWYQNKADTSSNETEALPDPFTILFAGNRASYGKPVPNCQFVAHNSFEKKSNGTWSGNLFSRETLDEKSKTQRRNFDWASTVIFQTPVTTQSGKSTLDAKREWVRLSCRSYDQNGTDINKAKIIPTNIGFPNSTPEVAFRYNFRTGEIQRYDANKTTRNLEEKESFYSTKKLNSERGKEPLAKGFSRFRDYLVSTPPLTLNEQIYMNENYSGCRVSFFVNHQIKRPTKSPNIKVRLTKIDPKPVASNQNNLVARLHFQVTNIGSSPLAPGTEIHAHDIPYVIENPNPKNYLVGSVSGPIQVGKMGFRLPVALPPNGGEVTGVADYSIQKSYIKEAGNLFSFTLKADPRKKLNTPYPFEFAQYDIVYKDNKFYSPSLDRSYLYSGPKYSLREVPQIKNTAPVASTPAEAQSIIESNLKPEETEEADTPEETTPVPVAVPINEEDALARTKLASASQEQPETQVITENDVDTGYLKLLIPIE